MTEHEHPDPDRPTPATTTTGYSNSKPEKGHRPDKDSEKGKLEERLKTRS